MSQELSPSETALYRAVDEVLHYVWDPIGVSAIPEARDEYNTYVPQVFGLVRDGMTSEGIAIFLSRIVVERMGLRDNPSHSLEVANILVNWKEFSRG
jgi:hypothetical protein